MIFKTQTFFFAHATHISLFGKLILHDSYHQPQNDIHALVHTPCVHRAKMILASSVYSMQHVIVGHDREARGPLFVTLAELSEPFTQFRPIVKKLEGHGDRVEEMCVLFDRFFAVFTFVESVVVLVVLLHKFVEYAETNLHINDTTTTFLMKECM